MGPPLSISESALKEGLRVYEECLGELMNKKFLIEDRSIIITGGAGLLGSTFVEAIIEIGAIL